MNTASSLTLLRRIHDQIRDFLDAEDRPSPDGCVKFESGRDIVRVSYPALGSYWLTRAQSLVVDELLDALLDSRSPDVDQSHLIRVSGTGARRLEEVFRNSRAWNTLVLRGEEPGTYRLAPLPPPPDDAA